MTTPEIAIIGAGMAGFGATYQLSQQKLRPVIYDERDRVGGHTCTYKFDDGFIFDDGPHISFTEDKRFQEILAESVDQRFERIKSYVNNYWQGHWIKHPAHVNLYGLPTDLIVKCVKELADVTTTTPAPINNYQEVPHHGGEISDRLLARATTLSRRFRAGRARRARTRDSRPALYRQIPLPHIRRLRLFPAPVPAAG